MLKDIIMTPRQREIYDAVVDGSGKIDFLALEKKLNEWIREEGFSNIEVKLEMPPLYIPTVYAKCGSGTEKVYCWEFPSIYELRNFNECQSRIYWSVCEKILDFKWRFNEVYSDEFSSK
ncbi:MAG: hypothetical protein JZD41_07575 [Thermoproteus sp.]|nr:hypothetical protein [Thermoproteus sp.]